MVTTCHQDGYSVTPRRTIYARRVLSTAGTTYIECSVLTWIPRRLSVENGYGVHFAPESIDYVVRCVIRKQAHCFGGVARVTGRTAKCALYITQLVLENASHEIDGSFGHGILLTDVRGTQASTEPLLSVRGEIRELTRGPLR